MTIGSGPKAWSDTTRLHETRAARTGRRRDSRHEIHTDISMRLAKANLRTERMNHTVQLAGVRRKPARLGGVKDNSRIGYRAMSTRLLDVRSNPRVATRFVGCLPDGPITPLLPPLSKWTTPGLRLWRVPQRAILAGALPERTAPSPDSGFRGSAYWGGAGSISIAAGVRSGMGSDSKSLAERPCSGTGRDGKWREL
jgi:hypothetical protein